jgi:hypothetical protein
VCLRRGTQRGANCKRVHNPILYRMRK